MQQQRYKAPLALAVTLAALLFVRWPFTAQAQPAVTGLPFHCSLDNVGATLTQCVPAAPDGQMRFYVTDLVATSTTATAGQFLLEFGTGTNCGTGTTAMLPQAASAVRLAYPGNTSPPLRLMWTTPIATNPGTALCVLAVATNTISIDITGRYNP